MSSSPSAFTAGRMWSSSPTDTPPQVNTRSCASDASRMVAMVASSRSGTMPMSVTVQPRRTSNARWKKRLELKMAPGFMSCGATSPGMTSSSPVENSATRGLRTTVRSGLPTLAARPRAAGIRRTPRCSTTDPMPTSSPERRIFWPGFGTALMRTEPAWAGLPPDAAAWPIASHSSCISTASAPLGIGAPVNMRAAVPGASSVPDTPAGIRCDTGNTTPALDTSA